LVVPVEDTNPHLVRIPRFKTILSAKARSVKTAKQRTLLSVTPGDGSMTTKPCFECLRSCVLKLNRQRTWHIPTHSILFIELPPGADVRQTQPSVVRKQKQHKHCSHVRKICSQTTKLYHKISKNPVPSTTVTRTVNSRFDCPTTSTRLTLWFLLRYLGIDNVNYLHTSDPTALLTERGRSRKCGLHHGYFYTLQGNIRRLQSLSSAQGLGEQPVTPVIVNAISMRRHSVLRPNTI